MGSTPTRGSMKVKEIIEKLNKLPEDLECLLAINQSAGFEDYDHMDVYPIEEVFMEENILKAKPKAMGYWHDEKENRKVLFYVFP